MSAAVHQAKANEAGSVDAARLRAERAAEAEDFAGRIAHDILNPLGTVAFVLDLAGRETDEQRRRQLLTRGTAAVQRIKSLVEGLLDFARAGGHPREGARADVAAAIGDLLTELAPTAKAADAELISDCADHWEVACTPGVLTSLIANLARNALKYLGESRVRRVEIRAQERSDHVRVEVVDTGPGVPVEIAEHLFEPYVRSSNARQPGIGLGLATVKRLAEAHGGRVGVDSVPSCGSTFWFELPKADAASPS